MDKRKLYTLTDSGFTLPLYIDEQSKVHDVLASNIPMLTWPDGSWCLPANLYMLELFSRGLSRKNRGGTLLSYATNISHLIRFCYSINLSFIDINDAQFSRFVTKLTKERKLGNPQQPERNSNSVIEIGRRSLEFLACVARLHNDKDFLGESGRIIAVQKEVLIYPSGIKRRSRPLIRKCWHHWSFPMPDPKKTRLPISTENIKKLRAAIVNSSNTIYQRKRRFVMLKLLEITGGRRSEIAALTVESVIRATQMPEPRLTLLTAKRRGGRDEYREIPIAKHDLVFLVEFIEKNRRRIVRNTCGLEKDDGYVLVSETTGFRLRPNTITQEIAYLASKAELHEKACPHMFRHAFITRLFVALIEQHNFENKDDFRRALLDKEGLMQEVQQWTGHRSIESLEVYIHLAFAEITSLKKTLNTVAVKGIIESFKSSIDQLRREVLAGMPPSEASFSISNLSEALIGDLERLE